MRNLLVNGLDFYELPDGSLFPVLAGAKGDAPEPTAEERALTASQNQAVQEQLKIARRQESESQALMPLLLQEYGVQRFEDVSAADPKLAGLKAQRDTLAQQLTTLKPTTVQTGRGTMTTANPHAQTVQAQIAALDKQMKGLDPGGKKTIRYEKTPDELGAKRKEIESMQLDRSLKALKGELPVTATLAKELELGKRTLAEKLSKQLGPGWETSSAGIQANAEYDRMATALREGEQKDQLTTAEALSIQRQGSREGANTNLYNTIAGPNAGASSLFANAGGSAGNALSYYGNLRNAKLQAEQTAAQERGGYASAIMGGAGLGVGAFLASDPELKTDIEAVDDGAMLLAVRSLPIKKWRYKDDPDKRLHIGGMADTMPEIVSDKKRVDVISYLGMLTGSIRALDKKLEGEKWSPALALAS